MNCVSSFPNCARVYSLAHKDIVDSELEIPGYKLFHRDRGNKGGGLAVYVRNDVKVMRRPNLEESTIEGLWVEVCPPKSRSFLVGTFYKPATSSNHAVKDFMAIFEICLRHATAMGKEVIITGHLNCNLLPKRTTESDCIKTTQGATETRKPYSAHKSAHSYYSILQNGHLEKPETGIRNRNMNGNANWNRNRNRRRNRNRNSNVNENRYKNRDTINLNIF